MNTIAAARSGGLRERIERLGMRIERFGQRMSAWAKAKRRQMTEDDLPVIQLSDEAAERLERSADEAERGIGISPVLETKEEMDAYLDEEVRKIRAGKKK